MDGWGQAGSPGDPFSALSPSLPDLFDVPPFESLEDDLRAQIAVLEQQLQEANNRQAAAIGHIDALSATVAVAQRREFAAHELASQMQARVLQLQGYIEQLRAQFHEATRVHEATQAGERQEIPITMEPGWQPKREPNDNEPNVLIVWHAARILEILGRNVRADANMQALLASILQAPGTSPFKGHKRRGMAMANSSLVRLFPSNAKLPGLLCTVMNNSEVASTNGKEIQVNDKSDLSIIVENRSTKKQRFLLIYACPPKVKANVESQGELEPNEQFIHSVNVFDDGSGTEHFYVAWMDAQTPWQLWHVPYKVVTRNAP